MKKTVSKRGLQDSGLSSVVLDAPGESFARKGATVDVDDYAGSGGGWAGGGPAPAGALQRGYGGDAAGGHGVGSSGLEEQEYVPRRGGGLRMRLGGLPRGVGGRILIGVVVFGVLGAAGVAIGGARYYMLHDQRFVLATSTDVQIFGDEHLAREQVLSVFAGDLERNVFRVPLVERRADLERLPWVAHATVMRLLPNKIRVSIMERTPVALVRQGSEIGLVDASGVLLDMPLETAGDPRYSFPVLAGVSAQDSPSTRAARVAVYMQFMKELDSSGEHLTNSLSEVDVSNPEDVTAVIASGRFDPLVHFGDQAFLARYREFEQHLPEWKQQYPKLASADMRYEGQIVLEMQSGAAATATPEAATADAVAADSSAPEDSPTRVAAVAPTPVPEVVKSSVKAKPAAVKLGVKPAAKGKAGATSASNEKMFAALKARAKASLAKGGPGGAVNP